MDVKFGKIRPNNNFKINLSIENSGDNFFANSNSEQNNFEQNHQGPSAGRINDLDSNILENNAYQTLPDELFKLEHKINNLEEMLAKLNNEIETLEGLGYDIQIYDLKSRKMKLEEELAELNSKYTSFGIGSKISGKLSLAVNSAKGKKNNIFISTRTFISKNVLSKISKKFSHKENLKEALENLSNINSSVDELIKLQVPYGESINRYDKLTAYINKANVIHSQISRNMNVTKNVSPIKKLKP